MARGYRVIEDDIEDDIVSFDLTRRDSSRLFPEPIARLVVDGAFDRTSCAAVDTVPDGYDATAGELVVTFGANLGGFPEGEAIFAPSAFVPMDGAAAEPEPIGNNLQEFTLGERFVDLVAGIGASRANRAFYGTHADESITGRQARRIHSVAQPAMLHALVYVLIAAEKALSSARAATRRAVRTGFFQKEAD